MMQTYGLRIRTRGENMKQTWIHIVLYISCMTLLLWQGHRIQQLRSLEGQQEALALERHQKMAKVTVLFVGCTQMLEEFHPGYGGPEELRKQYVDILGSDFNTLPDL
jgi:hypothetical protein